MPARIGVDIGGTFTDCFVDWDGKFVRGKAPTTYYNMGVGFFQAIEEASRSLGVATAELLKDVERITYGTTVSMNTLIERVGPKVGLITTMGFEDTILVGRAGQWGHGKVPDEISNRALVKKPEPVIPRELIVGVRERVDCYGNVIVPLTREEGRRALKYLAEKGVTGFVVGFLWSCRNPANELVMKEIIDEEFPDYYLGSYPIVLSSEIAGAMGEYPRFMTAVLAAYMQRDLADQLHGLGDRMRESGCTKPLITMQGTGASSSVIRTTAAETYASGPVGGLYGAAYMCRYYEELNNLILTDMGGTSFDYGLIIRRGVPFRNPFPLIEEFMVSLPLMEIKSIGAGGGSIGRVDEIGLLHVGPSSAGAFPGPLCYNLGGTEPTVTDADVVLGYINPDYYLGGRMKIDKELAHKGIKEKIASKMGMDVEEAAIAIRKIIGGRMGNEIYKEICCKGYDPNDFAVFAYGGAGPTHCCDYAAFVGDIPIYSFPFNAVFSAFGIVTVPISHIYIRPERLIMHDFRTGKYLSEVDEFNNVVKDLMEMAYRELEFEGIPRNLVRFFLDLDMRYGTSFFSTTAPSPVLSIGKEKDVKAICDGFHDAWVTLYGEASAYPEGGIEVTTFMLKASGPDPHVEIPAFRLTSARPPKEALKGRRPVFWKDKFEDTPIYEYSALKAGNILEGPAIVESPDTTYVLPEGKRLTVDRYLNMKIETIK